MRQLLRQIQRELKKANHCAVYKEDLNRVWPDEINASQKSRGLQRTMAFASAFIGTAYAPFSIKSQ